VVAQSDGLLFVTDHNLQPIDQRTSRQGVKPCTHRRHNRWRDRRNCIKLIVQKCDRIDANPISVALGLGYLEN
jgi:hypothetical protein